MKLFFVIGASLVSAALAAKQGNLGLAVFMLANAAFAFHLRRSF